MSGNRKLAFVLAASDHGTMIVSRLDASPITGFGVGQQILDHGAFEAAEVSMAVLMLNLRRKYFSDGVLAIDCGANIGVHTVDWARHMTGWGSVLAIEAQERVYYALAGNIAINNCFNARALHAAVTDKGGILEIPQPDYLAAGSLGSLELRQSATNEFIGQPIDYTDAGLRAVQAIAIDSLDLPRIDFIKLDIEGMEMDALAGAALSIATHRPVLLIEIIKSDARALGNWLLERDYRLFEFWRSVLAVHASDPILPQVKCKEWKLRS